MALHNGIDTAGFVSGGVFSKTFGHAKLKNRCNLFGFFGIIEDATKGITGRVIIGISARVPAYLFEARNPDASFVGKGPDALFAGRGPGTSFAGRGPGIIATGEG